MIHDLLRKGLAGLLAAALATAPAAAHAREPGSRIKIAVLDVNATGKLAKNEVEGLSALIASEILAGSGGDVIAGADIRSMVGFEKQRQMLGCSDTGCLAEIGGSLGADYIVGSEVSVVGGTYLLSLSLVDIKRAHVVSRLTRTTRSDKDLVPLTTEAVHEILKALPRTGEAAAPAAAPVATVAQAPQKQGKSSLPALVVLGVGGVALAGGGLLLLDAAKKRQDYLAGTDRTPTLSLAAATDLKEKGEAGRNLGYALLGGAVVLGVVGVLLLPRGDSSPKVSAAPLAGGAMVAAELPLP